MKQNNYSPIIEDFKLEMPELPKLNNTNKLWLAGGLGLLLGFGLGGFGD